jgi:TonB family protein
MMALSVWAQDWTPSKIVAMTEYPLLPRQARIQGTVEVRCTLDSDGNVIAAVGISGHEALREPARENALRWKFERASQKTQGASVILRYAFLLQGEPQDGRKSTFVFELPNKVQVVAPVHWVSGAP